jgi:hypothetical protein
MKSTAIWVLRHLIIPVGFIWATGIFSFIAQCNRSSSNPLPQFNALEYKALEMNPNTVRSYSDSLLELRTAQAHKGQYGKFEYFHDLKQYRMFEEYYRTELDTSGEGRMMLLHYGTGGMSILNALLNLSLQENWQHLSKERRADEESEIKSARSYWFPADVAHEDRVRARPIDAWHDIAKPLCGWLLRIYLRGFPIAFVMLLVWRFRFKRDYEDAEWQERANAKKHFGFTPLSFLISWLIWPIVLYRDIKNRWNQTLARAEVLSRRKNMLALLSKEEEKLVALGRKMSRAELKAHLDSIGQVRRHSFLKALVITCCLLVFIPKTEFSRPLAAKAGTVMRANTIPVDTDIGIHFRAGPLVCEICIAAEPPLVERECVQKILFCFPLKLGAIRKGYLSGLEGVPKGSNQIRMKMIW